MIEEIRKLFPDFLGQTSDILYYSKLKRFILLSCQLYSDVDNQPTDEEIRELEKLKNWFLIKDGSGKFDEDGIEVERNFLSLLSYLELKLDNTTLEFYSKLDYMNKKNQIEVNQIEQLHNR
jgi:hypothetical protein